MVKNNTKELLNGFQHVRDWKDVTDERRSRWEDRRREEKFIANIVEIKHKWYNSAFHQVKLCSHIYLINQQKE